ncbi:hypothetical protein GCM10011390_46770 [Aureimonas endophytica]|uniref:Uncharacterized protein n=1 Tax=Aureimonas endophytica TaxID=2027858 RepID=A0A917ED65_9HYPH|nr:hypothetical protein [Aureimonas endophytica]GGE22064.1 hypothetical protein GCM10011390_46770 [Aureimonas endophytica]
MKISAGLLALALLLSPAPARADSWTFRPAANGGSAGFLAESGWSGLWFACSGGAAVLTVSTFGARLAGDAEQRAVLDIDGTAFLQRMRSGTVDGGPVLRRPLTRAELEALAGALGKGRKAEIAMPAGRFALPLKGSGKALASLLAACR